MWVDITEANPPLLDFLVAKAEGRRCVLEHYEGDGTHPIDKCILLEPNVSGGLNRRTYRPSTNWTDGGPIGERERLEVRNGPDGLRVVTGHGCYGEGPTELIAKMRCFVHKRLGLEVYIEERTCPT